RLRRGIRAHRHAEGDELAPLPVLPPLVEDLAARATREDVDAIGAPATGRRRARQRPTSSLADVCMRRRVDRRLRVRLEEVPGLHRGSGRLREGRHVRAVVAVEILQRWIWPEVGGGTGARRLGRITPVVDGTREIAQQAYE